MQKKSVEIKVSLLKTFKRIIKKYSFQARWTSIRLLGESRLVKATVFIPVFGYIILFGEKYKDYLKVVFEDYSSWKMIFLYFGFTSIAFSTILFAWFCPRVVKLYKSEEDYIDKRFKIANGSKRISSSILLSILKYNKFWSFDKTFWDTIRIYFLNPVFYYTKHSNESIDHYIKQTDSDIVAIREKTNSNTSSYKINFIKKNNLDHITIYKIYEVLKQRMIKGKMAFTYEMFVEQILHSLYFLENHSKPIKKLACFLFFYLGVILVAIPSVATLISITRFVIFKT